MSVKKIVSTIIAAAAFIPSVLTVIGCAATGYTVYKDTAVFSDDIMFSAKIYGGRAEYAYERMKKVLSEIDAQVSSTRTDSDIYRFNAANADEKIEVGEHVYAMFNSALELYETTDGAFNVAAAPLTELWHLDAASIAQYRPDVDGTHISPPLPSPAEVAAVRAYCNPSAVTATEQDGKFYLEKTDARVKLDFGGIAKGYAVDECADILDEYDISSALIDISGNAYFYGDYIDKGEHVDWNVGVASPRPRAGESLSRGYICAFSTGGGVSAVTSGDYNRYYIHDGDDGQAVYVPHIIGTDGVPVGVKYDGKWKNADEYVISATVIGESSMVCDALATAAAALGAEGGARLLRKVGYKGLIFTEKRFTIIGDVALYRTDKYDGYKAYERFDVFEGEAVRR